MSGCIRVYPFGWFCTHNNPLSLLAHLFLTYKSVGQKWSSPLLSFTSTHRPLTYSSRNSPPESLSSSPPSYSSSTPSSVRSTQPRHPPAPSNPGLARVTAPASPCPPLTWPVSARTWRATASSCSRRRRRHPRVLRRARWGRVLGSRARMGIRDLRAQRRVSRRSWCRSRM